MSESGDGPNRVIASSRLTLLWTAFKESTLHWMMRRFATWLGAATRESTLYQWLMATPEPEVIVIDLRETRSLGTIIPLLDRLIDEVASHWQHSIMKRCLDAVRKFGDRAAQTRTGQLLMTLAVPSEPPEDDPDHDE